MDRRSYLAATGTVLTGALAGCTGETDTPNNDDESGTSTDGTTDTRTEGETNQMGLLSTAVSDEPADIGDFETLEVTIKEIWVHPKKTEGKGDDETESTTESSDNQTTTNTTDTTTEQTTDTEEESDEDEDEGAEKDDGEESEGGGGGKIVIDAGGAKADLVELQGEAQKVINNAELPVGEYTQVKLWVADEVNAVLKDGSQADVMTPGNAPLKFNKAFEIRAGTKTTFTADFAPHKRGPNGYILKPVADKVAVNYTEIETDASETTDSPGTTNSTDTTSDNTTAAETSDGE